MNIKYLLLRFLRHNLPESLTRKLMHRKIIIKPGLETSDPVNAAARYTSFLKENSLSLQDKHVFIFGYGGSLAVAVELLRSGSSHVTVCDLFPPHDQHLNDALIKEYPEYLFWKGDSIIPKPDWISVYHGDIRNIPATIQLGPFDFIVSSSVFEHLGDVNGITAALSRLMRPSGCLISYIDLRDHYFNYPFEMLCYSNSAWQRWLNPTSNLNRYRMWDYHNIFERYFSKVKITILERDLASFNKMKSRIRKEFLSGNESQDSVTLIMVHASQPIEKYD